MAKVILKNWNMGGIADSAYLGADGSVAEMVGFDIHSKPGVLRVNNKLTKESGTTVTEACVQVTASDGNTYFFSTASGKIWSRAFGTGTYALEATNANGAHSDVFEYQGKLYYSNTTDKLGRWTVGNTWASRTDSWATFTNPVGTAGMIEINQVLYIGNGSLIAQVDTGVFTANILDLETALTIAALGRLGTDLVVGAYKGSRNVDSIVVQWDTFSPSYSIVKPVPENIIYSIMPLENILLINAGDNGNLYTWDGVDVKFYKRFHYDTAKVQNIRIQRNAWSVFNGILIFGLSQLGAPCVSPPQGIYSIGRSGRGYPIVMNCENLLSTNSTANVFIRSISVQGISGIYLVSWTDTTSGTVIGVDVLDLTALFASAYFISRNIVVEREKLNNYKEAVVAYDTLPANTDITVDIKKNHGSFTSLPMVTDTDRSVKKSSDDIGEAAILQVKVSAPVTSGTTSPEIEQVIMNVE